MSRFLLSDIVNHLGGTQQGEDVTVTRIAPLQSATEGDISFLSNPKYKQQLQGTQASAVIVHKNSTDLPTGPSYILSDDPYVYFAKTAHLFHPKEAAKPSIHPSAYIDPTASVPEDCEIGPHVSIGAYTVLGARCRILANTVIESHVSLGDDTLLHPNVTIYHDVRLGHRVEIHSGTVIGADGFGIAREHDHWLKIPQTGSVWIDDDVEIGANTCIDRGALENTLIGKGCKIDNQVQIAHNCVIGEHTAIAACTGISGSTHIGKNCIIGGGAMFVGHISIADGTYIGGGTAVTRSITQADHYASCYPIQTQKEWARNAVHLRHLNDINKRIKALEKLIPPVDNQ